MYILEAKLLQKNNKLKEAKQTLNNAILEFPEQQSLRLERSFLSERLGNIDQAEDDLRFVIEKEPNNAAALNALGYTLANRTNRYDEALELINKAISLQPDDPAILDSLGWVLYRLGRLDEAIANLENAFNQYHDDEIAAHLIEAYWHSGQKKKMKRFIRSLEGKKLEGDKTKSIIEKLEINH